MKMKMKEKYVSHAFICDFVFDTIIMYFWNLHNICTSAWWQMINQLPGTWAAFSPSTFWFLLFWMATFYFHLKDIILNYGHSYLGPILATLQGNAKVFKQREDPEGEGWTTFGLFLAFYLYLILLLFLINSEDSSASKAGSEAVNTAGRPQRSPRGPKPVRTQARFHHS